MLSVGEVELEKNYYETWIIGAKDMECDVEDFMVDLKPRVSSFSGGISKFFIHQKC
jgi:hypothetical protein